MYDQLGVSSIGEEEEWLLLAGENVSLSCHYN